MERLIEMKKTPRKIIQIATGSFTFPNEPLSEGLKKPVMQETHELYALCDDGTLWSSRYYQNFRQGKWIQLEPIPQDGKEN